MNNRVLFVDDDEHFLRGIRRTLLTEAPYLRPDFASSVDEAIERIESDASPDAVVTDVNMPGKDGFHLLEYIASLPEDQRPVSVVLTGMGDSAMKSRALELGATDLLDKPVTPHDLRARLTNMLRLKRYQDELRAANSELEARVAQRTRELEQARLDVIWRLARAAEFRDEQTANHVLRVALACREVAEALGLEREFVRLLSIAAPLHDIGKIGIPDSILLKPGALTGEERAIMQTHCEIGAAILNPHIGPGSLSDNSLTSCSVALQRTSAPAHCQKSLCNVSYGLRRLLDLNEDHAASRMSNQFLAMAASIALSHHEKWDGSGYPSGLSGEAIPLEGRILGVCDVWDALRSARPYKEAFSDDIAMEIMRSQVEKHFDPEVFAAFQSRFEAIRGLFLEYPDVPQHDQLQEAA